MTSPTAKTLQKDSVLEKLQHIAAPISALEQKIQSVKDEIEKSVKTQQISSSLRTKCLGLVEESTRILLQVDAIDSGGDPAIRVERKAVVKKLEQLISEAEQAALAAQESSSPDQSPKSENALSTSDSNDDNDDNDDNNSDADDFDGANKNQTDNTDEKMNTMSDDDSDHDSDDGSDDDSDDDSDDGEAMMQEHNHPQTQSQIPSKQPQIHNAKHANTPQQQKQKQTQSTRSQVPHNIPKPHPSSSTTCNSHRPTLQLSPATLLDRGSHYLIVVELPQGTRPNNISIEPKQINPPSNSNCHRHYNCHCQHNNSGSQHALVIKGVHGASFLSKVELPQNANVQETKAQLDGQRLIVVVPKLALPKRRACNPWISELEDPFSHFVPPQFGW
eukprot:c7654_g1_i1.p1 GENE.c7654_g1_i1~~c7654_g1_i1.p1  ORF type:complete len:389 (-),score=128.73 c7654_g1_i1:61-1227(-)